MVDAAAKSRDRPAVATPPVIDAPTEHADAPSVRPAPARSVLLEAPAPEKKARVTEAKGGTARREARRARAEGRDPAAEPSSWPEETAVEDAAGERAGRAPESVVASEAAMALDEADARGSAAPDRDEALEACRKAIATHREHAHRDERYTPDAEQQLALGQCYAKLGDETRARRWLERALAQPSTKKRARAALRRLAEE
jgi:tetratricopeptide (TPR) repeat protein